MTTLPHDAPIGDHRSDVMALIAKMRQAAEETKHTRIMQLTDQMEVLVREMPGPASDDMWLSNGKRLTGSEARVLGRLKRDAGRVVSKESLMDAVYFDRVGGDEPPQKIMDVFICKLRQKLPDSGYLIETIWGYGYTLRIAS